MQGSTVFLVAFFTSAITSIGSVYMIEKYEMIPKKETPAVTVPTLVGLSEQDAKANAGLLQIPIMVSEHKPSDKAEGTVLSQSIPPGQKVPPNHPISIVLAEAPPTVPEVLGLVRERATAKLEKAGYEVKLAEPAPHASAAAGTIFEQSPAAGKPLKAGETVELKESSGPGEVEVPKVLGLPHTTASKKIEEVGLTAKVQWVSLAETASMVVLRQKPNPGEKIKPKEEVVLVVNR